MTTILENNLNILRLRQPEIAQQIAQAEAAELQWQTGKIAGMPSAQLSYEAGGQAKKMTLASRFSPDKEAARMISEVDAQQDAAIFMMGIGLGYQMKLLVEQLNEQHLLVAWEPDVGLLKAVMSEVDCAAWLSYRNLVLFTGEIDLGVMIQPLEPYYPVISSGMKMVYHPAVNQLYGEAVKAYTQQVMSFADYAKMNVVTVLAHAVKTAENLMSNVFYYSAGAGIDELKDAAKGKVAICIAAGPSLSRNIHLLQDENVRKNVVIITVQTMLKPLLAWGIRPDYVTALDHHQISARFYEDLPDVSDITLVAEPKSNAAITDNYPGPMRLLGNQFIDEVLGEAARPMAQLPPGSTVAHLSFYLAQYLGCDPIVFIGQDLGFSDGLYYVPGTAIHDVWAPELNRFNTLEDMEWQRVVRHRKVLKRCEDIHGQPIYSDQQMLTYAAQFERDFAQAPQRIIDATEGGLAKSHTERMALAEVLATCATQPIGDLPFYDGTLDIEQAKATLEAIKDRQAKTQELRHVTVRSTNIINKMIAAEENQKKLAPLFDQLEACQLEVRALANIFKLVEQVNQAGVLRRYKTDRGINLDESLTEIQKQSKRLIRDRENMDVICEGCDELLRILAVCRERMVSQLKALEVKHG